ncbi:hypothetical protein F5Y03DRAFT_220537 [Xylaria venustula]|nr:hypothetical protein F5Y03DRAFT_220537 [Xylaria venustula]
MRFSTHGSVAMAMVASVATATPHTGLLGLGSSSTGLDLSQPVSANVDLNADLSGKVLVAGLLGQIAVGSVAEVDAAAKVAVVCEDCHIKGDIDASISLEKVVPALSLSLKDIEILLDLDVYIGAAATIAVNLVTPAKVELPLPGIKIEALVHLDLVLGVHTELDLSAGVYVSLPEASLETDILSGDILDVDFSGVAVKVLPIKVRIGCTELLADLRLRVDLALSADVDVDEILPLNQLLPGLNIPTIGAGLEVAVFANLLEYVGLFCAAPECPLAKEVYGLNVGAAVELDVAVEDLLSIHLAPTVATAVLSIPTHTICIPSYTASPPPYSGSATPSSIGYSSGIPTSSFPGLPTGIPTSSNPGSSSGISTPAGPASSSDVSSTGPASVPISSVPGSIGTPSLSLPGLPTGIPTLSLPTGVPTSSAPGSSTGASSSSGPGSSGVPTSSGPAVSSTGAVTTPASGGNGYTTSTVTNTETYTVTACAVNVANCPAGYQTSVTVVHTTSYTTVCPVTATQSVTAAPAPTSTGGHNIESITKHVTTMVPCNSTSTFVPPTQLSTVPYPSDVPTHTGSSPVGSSSPSSPAAGYPGNSVPTGSSQTSPAAGYPGSSVPTGSVSSSSPAGGYGGSSVSAGSSYSAAATPSNSVPVGYPSPSSAPGSGASYPAGGSSASYSAAASPSYPAGAASSSYPAGGASSSPVGVPSSSVPAAGPGGAAYPTSVPYPSGYPSAGNSTVPTTWATYQPSVTTPAGYPVAAATTPAVATAGVGKVGSSVAAVIAVMGAVIAL